MSISNYGWGSLNNMQVQTTTKLQYLINEFESVEYEITVLFIVKVMMSFIIGNTSLGRSLPEIEFFANAKRAAASIFKIIDRVSF